VTYIDTLSNIQSSVQIVIKIHQSVVSHSLLQTTKRCVQDHTRINNKSGIKNSKYIYTSTQSVLVVVVEYICCAHIVPDNHSYACARHLHTALI